MHDQRANCPIRIVVEGVPEVNEQTVWNVKNYGENAQASASHAAASAALHSTQCFGRSSRHWGASVV